MLVKVSRASFFLSLLGLIQGCATATPYAPAARDPYGYGYSIEDAKGDIKVAVFKGNANTSSVDAYQYSMLAAYDYCHREKKYALVTAPVDGTSSQTYTQVYSMPVYGKNGSLLSNNVSSYPVTKSFPKFTTGFMCFKNFNALKDLAESEDLSRELVHPTTKDFKGGILVKSVERSSPKTIQASDVITALEDQRVEKHSELMEIVRARKPGPVNFSVVRSEKLVKVQGEVVDETDTVRKSTLGVLKVICSGLRAGTSSNSCAALATLNQ